MDIVRWNAPKSAVGQANARRFARLLGPFAILWAAPYALAEEWHDPSAHQIKMVTVAPRVRIEVLDWGGQGRAVILIAGSGGSAHGFDDFAPLLAAHFHVYGVTRRGFGGSSRPRTGYGADRLGDDVVAVIHALHISKPIPMGHSFGGQEVSDVATRFPASISGAVYLDAVYSYDRAWEQQALYWNVEWKQQIEALQKQLTELLSAPFNPKEVATRLRDQDLPAVAAIAANLVRVESGRPPWVNPEGADLQSYAALREWYHRIMRVYLPEAEFRQMQRALPDGRPSTEQSAPDWVVQAMQDGRKAFHHIGVPALYIGAQDDVPASYAANDAEARANAEAYAAYQKGWVMRRTERFTTDAPHGRLVIIKGASHQVFASNPEEVLQQTLNFAATLPP